MAENCSCSYNYLKQKLKIKVWIIFIYNVLAPSLPYLIYGEIGSTTKM